MFSKRFDPEEVRFVVAIGEPKFRLEAFEKMTRAGYKAGVLVHKTAQISPDAEVGEGTAVCDGAFIGSQARVGRNCYISMDKIYQGLIYVDLGAYDENLSGRNFYLRDESGQPTGDTTMPGENDWGQPSYAIYYLCDVIAGQFFQPGENFFVSGEPFMMHNLAEAYVLQYGA